MVVVPKARKTYCPYKTCRTHTTHKVAQYKKGKESTAAQGRRRYDRKQSGTCTTYIRLWRTDEAHLQEEGQDHKEDYPEAGMHEVQEEACGRHWSLQERRADGSQPDSQCRSKQEGDPLRLIPSSIFKATVKAITCRCVSSPQSSPGRSGTPLSSSSSADTLRCACKA